MDRILYTGTRNASTWAFRAWLSLREAGVEFEERVVDIRRPQRSGNLAHVGTFSPTSAVPVLLEGGVAIFDSLAIMEYANELGGGRLLPRGLLSRAQARAMLAWQHAGLSGICSRVSFESVFAPRQRSLDEGEMGQAARLFDVCEQFLMRSEGDYLFGELSLADLALVPSMIRIVAHTGQPANWPRTQRWSERLIARPLVLDWMDEARALPPVQLEEP